MSLPNCCGIKLQFSVRTLLIVMTVVATFLAGRLSLMPELSRAEARAEAAEEAKQRAELTEYITRAKYTIKFGQEDYRPDENRSVEDILNDIRSNETPEVAH